MPRTVAQQLYAVTTAYNACTNAHQAEALLAGTELSPSTGGARSANRTTGQQQPLQFTDAEIEEWFRIVAPVPAPRAQCTLFGEEGAA